MFIAFIMKAWNYWVVISGGVTYCCELASHTLTGSLVPRDLLESRKFFSIWAVVVLDREYFGKYHFYMSHML